MSERPILFCADMVRAYLAGRKWQTRRVIKLPHWSTETWSDFELDDDGWPVIVDYKTGCLARIPCPYGGSTGKSRSGLNMSPKKR